MYINMSLVKALTNRSVKDPNNNTNHPFCLTPTLPPVLCACRFSTNVKTKRWVISESRSIVLHIYAKIKLCFWNSYFAPSGGLNKVLTVRGPLKYNNTIKPSILSFYIFTKSLLIFIKYIAYEPFHLNLFEIM